MFYIEYIIIKLILFDVYMINIFVLMFDISSLVYLEWPLYVHKLWHEILVCKYHVGL